MDAGPVGAARDRLQQAIAQLTDAAGPAAGADEVIDALRVCEEARRALDRAVVEATADLQRRGVFAERGYRSPTGALSDLLGWERFEARRRVIAAENVCEQIGLDGTAALPARLPATATVFASGEAGLRHVEVIARLLDSGPARRLDPKTWAGAEVQLAANAAISTPSELHTWGTQLLELLDQDGPEPDDTPPAQLNELRLSRFRTRPGGKLAGRYDDAALFDAIAAAVDAGASPRDADDQRSAAERQAEALAEVCAQVLSRGRLSEAGGRRPQLTVTVRLEDLERRAANASLEFGGQLTPQTLRQLACDAAVIPVVLDGTGVPLDVGRISRTVPDGLRRAVTVRDRGCAFPGCDRPPSWCDIHHVREWQHGGPTALHNLVMLCSVHHRLIHHSHWEVRMVDGLPEFLPPSWIDRSRTPRRRPPPVLTPLG
ncbi:HNH endonuclease signature motif containing protein [Pseudonocardia halophobica]|uniref:HNH endonuclease n=1 Tax=Pseudonocardia halophobica TaxID=29401 RepID=A0A9W6KZI0_9PSEU|nr:HNH endonuclease signature motif containing protein [Pseudonocardia halophobica]GLL10147.1 HNH endonuclease [Pseudonocardia halophobica]